MKKTINDLVNASQEEYRKLKSIKKKFPDAYLDHLTYKETVLVARTANSLVDRYLINDRTIGFYLEWEGTKIFADPLITRLYGNYHERDWLDIAIERKIPASLLIKAIRETRSHYLSVKYYLDKYPPLRSWLAQY